MELTAIGDVVNLASRLEGVTKEYHIDILIGADAAELVREKFHLLLVDSVQVKGRAKPLDVYFPLGRATGDSPRDPETAEWMRLHHEGLKAYRARDFLSAEKLFAEAARIPAAAGISGVYIKRCREYLEQPPGPEWDGVYVMKSK